MGKLIDITRNFLTKEVEDTLKKDPSFKALMKMNPTQFKSYIYLQVFQIMTQLNILKNVACDIKITLANLHGKPLSLKERQLQAENLNFDFDKMLKTLKELLREEEG